jgi:hypothetical protein
MVAEILPHAALRTQLRNSSHTPRCVARNDAVPAQGGVTRGERFPEVFTTCDSTRRHLIRVRRSHPAAPRLLPARTTEAVGESKYSFYLGFLEPASGLEPPTC